MSNTLLNIGVSGLFTAQAGMSLTGQNIANVNTAGYTRQSLALAAGAGGSALSGVRVAGVERAYSAELASMGQAAQAEHARHDAGLPYLEQLTDLLADGEGSPGARLAAFADSMRALAANPGSGTARQLAFSAAQALATHANAAQDQLVAMQSTINAQLEQHVSQLNALSEQVAGLNRQLLRSGGASANDLLANRDALLGQMSALAGITVHRGDDQQVRVTLESGQPLINGQHWTRLGLVREAGAPHQLVPAQVTDQGTAPLHDPQLSQGRLGGLLETRREVLDPLKQNLDGWMQSLADSVNALHRSGVDADGNTGRPLFALSTDAGPPGVLRLSLIPGGPRELAAAAAGEGPTHGTGTALALARLPFEPGKAAAGASLLAAYDALAAGVATQTLRVQVAAEFSARLAEDAHARQEGLTGVNLDEEAANLLRYQQAYMASAKLIQTAGRLFDAALEMHR